MVMVSGDRAMLATEGSKDAGVMEMQDYTEQERCHVLGMHRTTG